MHGQVQRGRYRSAEVLSKCRGSAKKVIVQMQSAGAKVQRWCRGVLEMQRR